MKYTVLRGLNQIGGSVVEIETDAKKRIWIDFGSELSVAEENSTDKYLIERMNNKATAPHAVFFTHIHGDHIGLLAYLADDVDIYMGPLAKRMFCNIRKTLIKRVEDDILRSKLQRELDLVNRESTELYQNKKQDVYIEKLGISYTALRVDHSVMDSYMLKFHVDGKVIVHTGDFREHGRLGKTLLKDVEETIANEAVDILISEGTMMSRLDEEVVTEMQMEKQAEDILKKYKHAFLLCSSTNTESLASFYNAMKNTGDKKIFYCNSYVKEQLDLYTESIGVAENREEFVFSKTETIRNKLRYQKDKMKQDGFVMLVGKTSYYHELMELFRDVNPALIYSMWGGYLVQDKAYTDKTLLQMVNAWEPNVERLHTSGHATADTLSKVIKIINPREVIQPIHTENPFGFYMLDIDNEFRDLIHVDLVDSDGNEITDWKLPKDYDFSTGKKDTRAIVNKYPDMWKALKPSGSLAAFVELVKEKDDLELCFRGNTKRQCTIYYHNHEFFKICLANGKPKLSFNMNHARYWDKCLNEEISKRLFDQFGLKKHYNEKNGFREYVSQDDNREYTLAMLRDLYDIRKEMLESYFSLDPKQCHDYYQDKDVEIIDKLKQEKMEQQKLMTANTDCENGYYIYDMEYIQAYESEVVKKTYNRIVGGVKQNKPDSLAIRFEKGIPKALVFVELKSTAVAMEGGSDIIHHIRGMKNYVNNPLNKPFLEHRKKEAFEILCSYKELGLHNCIVKDLDENHFMNNLDIEILTVLTDNMPKDIPVDDKDKLLSARDYFENPLHKKWIMEEAKCGKKKCGILLLEKGEFKLNYHDVI